MRFLPLVLLTAVACGTEPTVDVVGVHEDAQALCRPEGVTCIALAGPERGGPWVLELFEAERVKDEVSSFMLTRMPLDITPRQEVPLIIRAYRSLLWVRLVPDVQREALEVNKLGEPAFTDMQPVEGTTDIEHELRTWDTLENHALHRRGTQRLEVRPQPFFDTPDMDDLVAHPPMCFESQPFFAEGNLGLIDLHSCADSVSIDDRVWDVPEHELPERL